MRRLQLILSMSGTYRLIDETGEEIEGVTDVTISYEPGVLSCAKITIELHNPIMVIDEYVEGSLAYDKLRIEAPHG